MARPWRLRPAVRRKEPGVSVVIPTLNRSHYLRDALQSALGQEAVAVEVIVVDDGSDDETPALLAAVADNRVRVVRNERPMGQAAARNAGLRLARHEWTAFLDDDDLWSPEKLRLQVAAAASVGAGWAYCGAVMLEPDGRVSYRWRPPDPTAILTQLLRRNVLGTGSSNVLVFTDLLASLGGFDEQLPRLDDWELWIRLAERSPAAAVDVPLVACRRHAGNLSAGGRRDVVKSFRLIATKHAELAARVGVPLERGWVERWLEAESLGAKRRRAAEHAACGRRFRAAALHLRSAVEHRSRADVRLALAVAAGHRGRAVARRIRGAQPAPVGNRPIESPAWLLPYASASQPARR
jgi:glycosyltransferase involved in cell wall biosynthesis